MSFGRKLHVILASRASLFFSFLLAGFLVFSLSPQPVDMIQILRKDPSLLRLLRALDIQVLQELETCFIARVTGDDLSLIEKNRIPYAFLDRDIGDRAYVLVHSPAHRALSYLDTKGTAVPLEKDTVLFWTEEGDPQDVLPPELARKPLPSESILPYLRPPLRPPEEREIALPENEVISQIVSEISPDSLKYFVQSLQGFVTRYASTANCEAAGDYISNYFQSIGLKVEFQSFPFKTYISRNVIAELSGRTYLDDILIICAHYDSTSKSPTALAPGADDNASGTAAVMEAARILIHQPLDFTVRFIAFSAEEHGLYGSRAYAGEARIRNEKIIGVVNLDMIAYADFMPEDLEVIVNPSSEWMAEKTILCSQAFVQLPVRKIVSASFVYSDHAAFWERGYYAFLGIEDNPIANPYYHTVNDTAETLNIDFFTSASRLALATLSHLAQPIRPGYPRTPGGLSGRSEIYSSLFHSLKNVTLSWSPSLDAVGYNVYRTTVPHLNYKKLNSSPLTILSYKDRNLRIDTPYFYAVTAINAAGLESNYSRELEVLPESPSFSFRFFGNTFLLFKLGNLIQTQ